MNKQGLVMIIDLIERGTPLLPGEIVILRDAVDLLADTVDALDKIMANASELRALETIYDHFDRETTAQMKVITDDDHGGHRP